MTLRLTRLDATIPIVTADGRPTQQFLRLYNEAMDRIEQAFASIETVNEQQQEAIEAIQAAQAAADAANEAAATAQAAAAEAATAATDAQTAAGSANEAIEQIEAGEFDLTAVKIGGTKFINNGGNLEPEPV